MYSNHTIEKNLVLKYELVKKIAGKYVFKIYLANNEMSVAITNIGCSVMEIQMPGREGQKQNIIAAYKEADEYLDNRHYFGCVIGRYANRIAKGRFTLNGNDYQLPVNNDGNHLHGGVEGFNKKIWEIHNFIQTDKEAGVQFKYVSLAGEEGYPGTLTVFVTYLLNDKNQLLIQYEAVADKATPVNFTNHSYFNLTGFTTNTVRQHLLQVNAKSYTEKNSANVPTGNVLPVKDSALDFTELKMIGTGIQDFPQDHGYDHNFVLEKNEGEMLSFAAILKDPVSGRTVNVFTTQPGLQVYTANFFDGTIKGSQDVFYQQHSAVALEAQSFPDSPNHPEFPNTILKPGETYISKTMYEFIVE